MDPTSGGRRSPARRSGAAGLFGEGGSLSGAESPAARTRASSAGSAGARTARARASAASTSDTGRTRAAAASGSGASGTGRTRAAAPTTRRTVVPPPPSREPRTPPPPPDPPRYRRSRLRTGLCVASALVLVLTGVSWALYHDITAGITTTNVISGGSSTGDQNILLVGVDSRTDAQGNPLPADVLAALHGGADSGVINSDTIIVLHVPSDGSSATAFSIPRDSYVDIPGYRRDKINAAYPATKELKAEELVKQGGLSQQQVDQQSSAAGRSTLIGAVQNLTGLHVDHYAEINLLGFANLTDAIGGVQVCLNAPVNDDFSGANFPAGPQTISGPAALAFVRQRHGLPEGDLSRIRRQQVFLAAVAHKVLSSGTLTNPSTLSSLIGAAQKSLVIDSGWDLLGFARHASSIAAGKMQFLTVPTQGTTTNSSGDVVVVDPNQVKSFVADKTNPAPPTTASAPPAAPGVDPATVTVDVGNGSGTTGLAGQVADQLAGAGYVRGTVDNAPSRNTSVVRYTGSDPAAAQAVAAKLGGIGVEESPGVATGHVQVLIGTDYRAPVASPSAAAPPAQPAVTAGGVPCID